jgi:hypothetical protein
MVKFKSKSGTGWQENGGWYMKNESKLRPHLPDLSHNSK